jgi:hypothetical protein
MVRANRGLAAAVCLAFTLGLLASGDLLVGSNKASGPAVSSPWAGGVNERPVVRSVPSRLFSPVGLGPPPAYRVGQPPSSSLPENVNPHDGPAVKPRYELIESQKAIAIPARLRGEPY